LALAGAAAGLAGFGDFAAAAPFGAPFPILHERQRVRLRDDDQRPWQEILEALRSGLDPNEWFPIPPNVGPYPGLVAFDEKDAGVFFGRKQEITEYLGILDTLRGPDRSQVLVISGASGSGKSSPRGVRFAMDAGGSRIRTCMGLFLSSSCFGLC
jgi:hypothetical protein